MCARLPVGWPRSICPHWAGPQWQPTVWPRRAGLFCGSWTSFPSDRPGSSESQPTQAGRFLTPVLFHPDPKLKKNPSPDKLFNLDPGELADALEHGSALADNYTLLRFLFHEYASRYVGELLIGSLGKFIYDHRHRVRHLFLEKL